MRPRIRLAQCKPRPRRLQRLRLPRKTTSPTNSKSPPNPILRPHRTRPPSEARTEACPPRPNAKARTTTKNPDSKLDSTQHPSTFQAPSRAHCERSAKARALPEHPRHRVNEKKREADADRPRKIGRTRAAAGPHPGIASDSSSRFPGLPDRPPACPSQALRKTGSVACAHLSPVTVAGAAPALHRLPCCPAFHVLQSLGLRRKPSAAELVPLLFAKRPLLETQRLYP